MANGFERFNFYLIQLDQLLLNASRSDDAAIYLYRNDVRTTLFMLEGLAKLYYKMTGGKTFDELSDRFKTLEDAFGDVDHYDTSAADFKEDAGIPVTVALFTESKRDEQLKEINASLLKEKWIGHDPSRTEKIRKKLRKISFPSPEKEVKLLAKMYDKAIADIILFYGDKGPAFTEVENDVHALRRKLRWLSIYPRAMQGAIQLVETTPAAPVLRKYLVPEIVNSPFNKMPENADNEAVFSLEKNYFLALSYMIEELGKLKDEGLRIEAIASALKATQFLSDQDALARATELSPAVSGGEAAVLLRAKTLSNDYFDSALLEKIIIPAV